MLNNENTKATVYCRLASEPKPRTALYCRTATHDDFAIENQKRHLVDFAEENGFWDYDWYVDNGKSGATLTRPAMNRLISDIRSGKVKTVIVTHADRIARGTEPMSEWVMLLNGLDVRFLTVDSGEDGLGCEYAVWLQTLCCASPFLSAGEQSNGANGLL